MSTTSENSDLVQPLIKNHEADLLFFVLIFIAALEFLFLLNIFINCIMSIQKLRGNFEEHTSRKKRQSMEIEKFVPISPPKCVSVADLKESIV